MNMVPTKTVRLSFAQGLAELRSLLNEPKTPVEVRASAFRVMERPLERFMLLPVRQETSTPDESAPELQASDLFLETIGAVRAADLKMLVALEHENLPR